MIMIRKSLLFFLVFTAGLLFAETRGAFAQRTCKAQYARQRIEVTYAELCRLLSDADKILDEVNSFNAFSDVPYDHPLNNAVYFALAHAYLAPKADGKFAEKEELTPEETRRFSERKNAGNVKKISAAGLLKKIWGKKRSRLAETLAVHCYKYSSLALSSADIPPAEKTALKKVLAEIRNAERPGGEIKNIHATPADPAHWIGKTEKGPYLREFRIKSAHPGTETVEVDIFSDVHFNYVNEKDEKEANPSIMSTKICREWLKNGVSKDLIVTVRNYSRFADQTIVAGDILDYMSWGAMQLTIEHLFRRDADMMACLGGHDIRRVMQGKVKDPTPLHTHWPFLQAFWPNDIHYASRILRNKVMTIVLDNGLGLLDEKYLFLPLERDLALARKEKLTVILVEHEPLCTRNPAEKKVLPISGMERPISFAETCVGSPRRNPAKCKKVYELITQNADLIGAVVCGHLHRDYYTEIIGSAPGPDGKRIEKKIPQLIGTAAIYGNTGGHMIRILVD